MKKRKVKILLVDDHPIVRQGLRQLIEQEEDLLICGEAEDDHQAYALLENKEADIALVDITLKMGSGLDLVKGIGTRFPRVQVIVVSMHDASLYAERTLRIGAKGYVMKQDGSVAVVTAIREVLKGKVYLSPKISGFILQKMVGIGCRAGTFAMDNLSNRELEVFQLLGQGFGTRRIAETLHLSVKTVESYREHIKDKMNLSNATELVHSATQWVESEGALDLKTEK